VNSPFPVGKLKVAVLAGIYRAPGGEKLTKERFT